jgi:nitrite reductase/ring-hydroxylating ferredoxin subunit
MKLNGINIDVAEIARAARALEASPLREGEVRGVTVFEDARTYFSTIVIGVLVRDKRAVIEGQCPHRTVRLIS